MHTGRLDSPAAARNVTSRQNKCWQHFREFSSK